MLEHTHRAVHRLLHVGRATQFQQQGKLLLRGRPKLPMALSQSMVPPGSMKREQVLVLLPVVVVNMRGADARRQQPVRGFDAFIHVGVAQVEAHVQIQMRGVQEI